MEDALKTALLDLLWELRDAGFQMILGGGYGLYLKQLHLQEQKGYRPLISRDLWPFPRATQDLDFLFPTEAIARTENFRKIRNALNRLEYEPKVKFSQFTRTLEGGRQVKVDFLVGPITDPRARDKIRFSPRRARPKSGENESKVLLHALPLEEALDFEEHLCELPLKGKRSDGAAYDSSIRIPQPFTLLLMKLHAFRDRREDDEKDFARHHAMDLYRIVAMLSETEHEQVTRAVGKHSGQTVIRGARDIVGSYFGDTESTGVLRVREHALFRREMDITRFTSELTTLFK